MSLRFQTGSSASKGARPYQEDAFALRPGADGVDASRVAASYEVASQDFGSLDDRSLDGGASESAPNGHAGLGGGQPLLIGVLADGMGGHAGGALASVTVCASFLDGFARDTLSTRDRLRAGLVAANRAIELKVEEKPALAGMGSTLIGIALGPAGMEWVSVGDSPLYLYRRGEIALINEDHSLAPALDELAAAGKISTEQAKADPRRHMLRSAITGDELELVDLSRKPLALVDGDFVIMASDGIHALETDEIARIVAAYGDEGAQSVASALLRGVEGVRDPHQDNITVVVVKAIDAHA